MILSEFEKTARGKVVFNDGEIIAGMIVDYTSSFDNDDRYAYLTIIPENGPLKGKRVQCPEDEVKFVEYLKWYYRNID